MRRDYLVSINTDQRIYSADSSSEAVALALRERRHVPKGTRLLVTCWLKGNVIEADTMLSQDTYIRRHTRSRSGSYDTDWTLAPKD